MTEDHPDKPGDERPEAGHRGSATWWHSQIRYLYAREFAAGKRVLDIACANGFGTILLAEVAREAAGLDVSPEAVEFARRVNGRANVRYEAVSKPPFPFPDGSFDLVVSLETIEHMKQEEQPAFIAELTRLLTPDGIFVFSTPDRETERTHAKISGTPNPYHLHTPSRDEIEKLLSGFPHRVELIERDFVATTVVPVDPETRRAKLETPIVASVAEEDRFGAVAVLRACARTPEGFERIRAARAPIAYRVDFQRLALISNVINAAMLPDVSAFPVNEQVAFMAERLRRTDGRFQNLEESTVKLWKNVDQLNRNLSVSGWLERLRGKRRS
jgi:SAM-dependent methyltransferase